MVGLRAFLGLFPNTSEFEGKKDKLEAEYKALKAFEHSEELKRYTQLDEYIHSKEFADKKEELLSLRFKQTGDYQKEKEFFSLRNSDDIKLFYKTAHSEELNSFLEIEKSDKLKKFITLQEFVSSAKFEEVKRDTSLPSKKKFINSDLGKTFNTFIEQSNSEKIKHYYKFINHKYFKDFVNAKEAGLAEKLINLENKINTHEFREKKQSLSKKEFKITEEYKLYNEYLQIKSSKLFKRYSELAHNPVRNTYDDLHGSPEIEAYEDLKFFINSDEFKNQKRDIENYSFKNTPEYEKLQEFEHLKKSSEIKFYHSFKKSKAYINYLNLLASDRIKAFEKLKEYIESKQFIENKDFCTKAPKKRWRESEPYQLFKEFEQLKDNEQIKWYFKGMKAKKFSWLRVWNESFIDDFTDGKLNTKKWLTRYYYGEELLKDSYSLSHDKHFVTDGKNIEFGNSTLKIITKKEKAKGKSWHQNHGFITREFGYTSGLLNTGKSFRQKYGTFEAKIKFHDSNQIQNAFWMVAKFMVPHINVAKANDKLIVGNAWGDAKNVKSINEYSKKYSRTRFSADFYIYTLEWRPDQLIWKINGIEVASTRKGVPQEPMYIVFSSGLHKDIELGLPAQMEVDWIRCYQHVDFKE